MIPERESILLSDNMTYNTYEIKSSGIKGFIDGKAALKQAVYKILMTERYEYIIYDRNYGIELKDLIGKSKHYICAVLKGRIEDALFYDTRFKSVKNWCVTVGRNFITAEFTVETELGDIDVTQDFQV